MSEERLFGVGGEITRPALKFYGGKWLLARWVASFFPPHGHYVELCCGAASVFLLKKPSPVETINDLDRRVVVFFRVLRDRPDELIRALELTPWARAEYEESKELSPGDSDLEAARKTFAFHWMSFSGGLQSGFSCVRKGRWRKKKSEITDRAGLLDNLRAIAFRLSGVQVEEMDCLRLLKLTDDSGALFYVDPPYAHETRTKSAAYRLEWGTEMHVSLAQALNQAKGYVVLSGYACGLYEELYEARGWARHDKKAITTGGARTESVWLSPRTALALEQSGETERRQLSLW